ncbi:MAG TPA: hypothetical protein H9744_04275 [Candidatus Eisenbergiella stercoravium]|nr:hypothetical protein [Candidatus Eisenbergiella stercoravium]
MNRVITALDDVSADEIHSYGRKAQNLWKMYAEGIRIPQTMLIACPQSWIDGEKEENVLHQAEEEVKRIFTDSEGIMVRSSFEFEDLERSSNAGKFKSIFVRDKSKTAEAIKEVWESAGQNWIHMGTVIQPYIEADYSGILFSVSPFGKGAGAVIEFTQGPCEQLVRGNITPDVYEAETGWKAGNVEYVSMQKIEELLEHEKRLRKLLGCNVDVEFCVSQDRLFLLQCRPMTTGQRPRPEYRGNIPAGTWVLQEELQLPFTPLVRTMDPSGLLSERPHIVFENYVYFSTDYRLKREPGRDWEDWESIWKYFTDNFRKIQKSEKESSLSLLEDAVKTYRELVSIYMNLEWFLYRKKCQQELLDALKKRFENYQDVFLRLIRSVRTINVQKRIDFVDLLKEKEGEAFEKKKTAFLEKYGAETSHPFYIRCRSLSDYFNEILLIAQDRKIVSEVPEAKENDDSVADEELRPLIDACKAVIKRTEDDDYLLCLGAYTIRQLLERLEKQIGLNRDEIYFLEYDELKQVLDGRKKAGAFEARIEDRKRAFENSEKYEMPLLLQDGKCVYQKRNTASVIQGETISPGHAKGQIYCLRNPGDIFEIMNIPAGSIVYSEWISPVLSSYFFNINGLLLPEVSILSHGAILAREMGIPAIGGISCGFVNGTEVEMDASEGRLIVIGEGFSE